MHRIDAAYYCRRRTFCGLCVCLLGTSMSPTKTTEPTEMLFESRHTWVQETMFQVGAHCRHWANTIEQSACGGDAASHQIVFQRLPKSALIATTPSNYFDHLLLSLLLFFKFLAHQHKAAGKKTRLGIQNYGCNGNLLCYHGVVLLLLLLSLLKFQNLAEEQRSSGDNRYLI